MSFTLPAMPNKKAVPIKGPVKHNRDERVTVVLSPDELARLTGAAEQQGISRSDVLRRAIREYPLPDAGTTRRA
jgi:hypothetical protein